MRYFSLFAALVLVACTSQQAINAQYAGEPLTLAFNDLGPPDAANALPDGQTEYIWRDPPGGDGVQSCFKRMVTNGSGTIVNASHSDGLGPC